MKKSQGIGTDEVFDACAVLDHFHREHTTDKITRFRNEDGADIYVVSDPEWKARLRTFVSPIFQVEVKP
jgi:hypothetical protein